jgi:hypothetical protein
MQKHNNVSVHKAGMHVHVSCIVDVFVLADNGQHESSPIGVAYIERDALGRRNFRDAIIKCQANN